MSIKEELLDRRNPDKWAHPELYDMYEMASHIKMDYGTVLNPFVITKQERKALWDKMHAQAASAFGHTEMCGAVEKTIKGLNEGDPDRTIYVTAPTDNKKKKLPCILNFPGGGLLHCMLDFTGARVLADEIGAVVVTATYRTINDEGGYPQTLDDCQAVYEWIINNAETLGINADKVVVFGASSGGHIATAFSHRLKNKGYHVRGCVAVSAILDQREAFPSYKLVSSTWDGRGIHYTCNAWLEGIPTMNISPETFANNASVEDCVGLPPTFIHDFESDPSVDPSYEYGSKLNQAGVYSEVHCWGGSEHTSLSRCLSLPDEAIESDYMKRVKSVIFGNIKDCFKYDLRRTWIQEIDK